LLTKIPDHDGAEPAGNSAALHNLLVFDAIVHSTETRLLGLADLPEPTYAEKAEKLIAYFAEALKDHPTSMADLLSSVLLRERGLATVIISGEGEALPFVQEVSGKRWEPDVVYVRESEGGKVNARVCARGTCGMKKETAEEVRKELNAMKESSEQ
jgi:uncharacterized protein YyaL (SSP411 family)